MQIRHLKTLIAGSDGISPITASAWAASGLKLAVCGVDRVVQLFDDLGQRKDRFQSKTKDEKPV